MRTALHKPRDTSLVLDTLVLRRMSLLRCTSWCAVVYVWCVFAVIVSISLLAAASAVLCSAVNSACATPAPHRRASLFTNLARLPLSL